uniref:Exonuclease domain-containing protein n=1 Tax=Macrostomum lignano TaxID=282301 RepID=A0A1I8IUU6_9PLAT
MEGRQRITELAMLAVHTFNLLEAAEAAAVSASPVANGNGDAAGVGSQPAESVAASPRDETACAWCSTPCKPVHPPAADLTRLDNKEFDRNAAALIDAFLSRLEPPVVLMAHNGLQFDFPLLRSELDAVGVSSPVLLLTKKGGMLLTKSAACSLVRCAATPFLCFASWSRPAVAAASQSCTSAWRAGGLRTPTLHRGLRQPTAGAELPPARLSGLGAAPGRAVRLSQRQAWRTLAVLDLETTGLYQPRVTELALLTADRADLLRRGGTDRLPQGAEPALPAVQPRLRGDALGREHHRLARRLPAVSAGFRLCVPCGCLAPSCGGSTSRFDFPLLQAELRLASAAAAGCPATADAANCLGSVLCSDSLPALRELQLRPGADALFAEPLKQGKPQVRFSLQQLYSQAFSGEEPPGSHSGLGDCEALLRLLLFRLPTACHCWRPRRRPSRPWRPPSCMSRPQRPPLPLRLLIDGGRG